MTTIEAAKLLNYLQGAYPQIRIPEATHEVWLDALGIFRYEVMRTAIKEYLCAPGIKRSFPVPGDVVAYYDRLVLQEAAILRQRQQDDYQGSAKKLFHEALPNDQLAKQSVQLIRGVCDGKLKFMSEEWVSRFRDIYGVAADPETGR